MVSMLALETAMLGRYGSHDKSEFRQIMIGASGAVICLVVLTMSVYMIIRSTQKLKELKINNSET